MPFSQAELQAQLQALQIARRSGVRSLVHAGVTTEYKSDAEMAAAERSIANELNALATSPTIRVSVAAYDPD